MTQCAEQRPCVLRPRPPAPAGDMTDKSGDFVIRIRIRPQAELPARLLGILGSAGVRLREMSIMRDVRAPARQCLTIRIGSCEPTVAANLRRSLLEQLRGELLCRSA